MRKSTTHSGDAKRVLLMRTLALGTVFALLAGTSTGSAAGKSGATAGPSFQPSAIRQLQALQGIKAGKTKNQQKIDSRLYLGILKQRSAPEVGPLTDFRFVRPDVDGRVAVDILVASGAAVKPVLEKLSTLKNGSDVKAHSARYRSIRARIPMDGAEELAAMPEVLKIRLAVPAFTSGYSRAARAAKLGANGKVLSAEKAAVAAKAGRAAAALLAARAGGPAPNLINTSEGDATHRAINARQTYGTLGAGVKVCVLSDAIDSLASLQASGDLPPVVDVLPGMAGSGGDEGTAMLEIVHDLAPGAALGFATAFIDEATFAQNILDLRNVANCDIIVDDIIYLDESPFQDNDVAQAVNTVTAGGALYFSSAGNEGNQNDGTSGTWEGNYLASAAPVPAPLVGGGTPHDFGDGGVSNLVTVGGAVSVLHWTDPFFTAANDYDIYDLDGALTTIFDSSADVQDGAGGDDFPVEIMGASFTGERLVVMKFSGADRMINFINFRGELNLSTNGATRGHSAAVNAFSTAAVPAAGAFGPGEPTGPFPGAFTAAQLSETFTSDGPRRIFFDNAGNLLPGAPAGNFSATGGVVRQKPDIAAADGVSCAAPGFNPFFGTSAAAPHAAAIAALIKSKIPAATNAQIRTALVSTAIDIELAGTDRDTGVGIVMPEAAILFLGGTPASLLTVGAPVFTQVAGDGDAYVEPGESWSIAVPVTNAGGASATGISSTLSTATAGVTMTNGASAYPDLAPAANANNTTPFTFTVSPTLACATNIVFNFSATYGGGGPSPATASFPRLAGSPGTPVTITFTGPPVSIPDGADLSGNNPGAPVDATLAVAGVGPIYSIQFRIDGATCNTTIGSTTVGIDHTFVNDLELTLISPAATAIKVIDNTDGSGNNFCQTLLQDGAATSIQSVVTANAPFTGTFSPANALAPFVGQNANGNWILRAQDFFSQDTGNIRAWSLIITPAVCTPVADVSLTKTTPATNVIPGQSVTFTLTATNNGPAAAAGVTVTDTIPAGMNYVSNTCGAAFAAPTLTWNIGAIPFPGNATCNVTVTMANTPLGPITNTATVATNATVINSGGNDTGSAQVILGLPIVTEVPTLGVLGLAALTLALAAAGFAAMRRFRS